MKSIGRLGVWAVLLVTSVSTVVVSCGSDDDKKKTQDEVGGQGGAAEPGTSGSPEQTPGGAAGQPTLPNGGSGGEPLGGAGGEPIITAGASPVAGGGAGGGAGAGGEGPVASCTPAGEVQDFAVSPEATYTVCRGARARVPFEAQSSPQTFACCAQSATVPSLAVQLSGQTVDGGGDLFFELAADAPLGTRYLTVSCAGTVIGEGATLALEITDTPPPVVTNVPAQVAVGGPLTISGTNLQGVSTIFARSADGFDYDCEIDPESQGATSVMCTFDGSGAGAASGYQLFVYQDDCGYALGTFTFTMIVPA